ncbi:hypothetical protein PV08_06292 [Exophiala spinifera]|uniref:Methyltransferase domain-containing protein n=1 Tax=Exophiala spinifera TaxID=91928 RepID=A0A0D1YMH7_9EURO|nr:uncharacterized protein PV08_06292 [Exophiala spinifera]KIW16241.1 hypothetical protein PV08_06292 [Exophiala spinifera]
MTTTTNPSSTYTQGYSSQTLATQQSRTVGSDAAFLFPHIKQTDHVLDVGCGPGTITTGFAQCANEGRIVGVDISTDVVGRARTLAEQAGIPTEGPGSVVFEEGNVLTGLAYADNTFDVVFCCQTLGYMPPPETPVKALAEMRRVLKPGGILAVRDTIEQHFYPRTADLDRLWVGNFRRAVLKDHPDADLSAPPVPALFRRAGFDVDGGKVRIGTASTTISGAETRQRLAKRAKSQLQPGDPLYQNWLDAGITEDEIQQTIRASRQWAETEDAWYVALQCETLAWK